MTDDPLRKLPPVHALLAHPTLRALEARWSRPLIRQAVRTLLDEARAARRRGEPSDIDSESLVERIATRLASSDVSTLRPVINATGVLLHTGLGRSPLAEEAIAAIAAAARGYCNLEIDLETGRRGHRTAAVASILRELTGAEAAEVVNNNAAATLLALKALAEGKEVLVSRGQLVEIGGSFRLPEIFEASGARLREVGTTNKTRRSDYEKAIGPATAAILRVHPSNYRIVGFTESVAIADLVDLGRAHGLWTIDDLGSGLLAPGLPPGLTDQPSFQESLGAGADLVLGSGDKLLGGPQCGILAGKRAVLDRIKAEPLMRAVRVDKLTLAALETTLRMMRVPTAAERRIPLWAMLATPVSSLFDRGRRIAETCGGDLGVSASVEASTACLGGGSAPETPIPSAAVRLRPPFGAAVPSEADLAYRLRSGEPAVFPRVQGGCVVLDLRAVPAARDPDLLEALRRILLPA